MAREGLLNGKTQYSGPPCKTSLDQLLFKMKILFTFIQKATLMRFSIVLTLLPQLVFLGLAINFAYFCHRCCCSIYRLFGQKRPLLIFSGTLSGKTKQTKEK
jgi:hypothetical protein